MKSQHMTDDMARRIAARESSEEIVILIAHTRKCKDCQDRLLRAERGARIANSGSSVPYEGNRCATDDEIEKHAMGRMSDDEMIEFDSHIRRCQECPKRLEQKVDQLNSDNLPDPD